jgi:hypothetical protein
MYFFVHVKEVVVQLSISSTAEVVKKIDASAILPGIFKLLGEEWGLNNEQQMRLLGLGSRQTLANWKKTPAGATLSRDLQERLSYLLGIHKSLRILFPERELARRWLFTPNGNRAFGGQAPMARLLNGLVVDLAFVRQFLDYERGL